jgi:hypothetical protein
VTAGSSYEIRSGCYTKKGRCTATMLPARSALLWHNCIIRVQVTWEFETSMMQLFSYLARGMDYSAEQPGSCPGRQATRGAKILNMNKYLKNIGLKGRQIISLPGAPTCLGQTLFSTYRHYRGQASRLLEMFTGYVWQACRSQFQCSMFKSA